MLILIIDIKAQDTLYLDVKTEYFSKHDSLNILKRVNNTRLKGRFSRVNLGKELIRINKNSAKVEECFYYDEKRICDCNQDVYFEIVEDTIIINHKDYREKWHYEKVNDSLYLLKRDLGVLEEIGYAKSLFPLEKIDLYFVRDENSDTLFSNSYKQYVFPSIESQYLTEDNERKELNYKSLEEIEKLNLLISENTDSLYRYKPLLESQIDALLVAQIEISEKGKIENIFFVRESGNGFFEKSFLLAISNLNTKDQFSLFKGQCFMIIVRGSVY